MPAARRAPSGFVVFAGAWAFHLHRANAPGARLAAIRGPAAYAGARARCGADYIQSMRTASNYVNPDEEILTPDGCHFHGLRASRRPDQALCLSDLVPAFGVMAFRPALHPAQQRPHRRSGRSFGP